MLLLFHMNNLYAHEGRRRVQENANVLLIYGHTHIHADTRAGHCSRGKTSTKKKKQKKAQTESPIHPLQRRGLSFRIGTYVQSCVCVCVLQFASYLEAIAYGEPLAPDRITAALRLMAGAARFSSRFSPTTTTATTLLSSALFPARPRTVRYTGARSEQARAWLFLIILIPQS